MRKENLFSIGDVARLFHISVGTLRHYESLGLVVPEAIDPDTGYRYYSVRQFEPLNTIRYLRALDMPLPKIAEFLSDRDVPRIERMLLFQKQQIAQKRRELELIDRKIDNRLRQLHDAQHCTLEEIALVQTRELRVALLEGALPVRSSGDLELPIRRLEPQKQKSAVFLGKVGVGLSREHLLGGEFFPYDVVFLTLDDEDETPPEFQRLPAALCARIHFCGSHTQASSHYRKLMDYLAENGLELDGFSREITLIDDGVTSDRSRFVTRIDLPVRKTKI